MVPFLKFSCRNIFKKLHPQAWSGQRSMQFLNPSLVILIYLDYSPYSKIIAKGIVHAKGYVLGTSHPPSRK
jgi:hypothetical protein